jgi:ERF superfamily
MSDITQPGRRLPLVPGPKTAGLQQTTARPPAAQDGRAPVVSLGLGRGQTPAGEIAKAIASVMAGVGTIEKRGINKFHGYAYARMEDVLQALTPLIGKAGLAIMQNEVEVQNIEGNRIRIIYEFTLFHEGGQALPPVRQSGTAMARDSKGNFDDKAFAKCHTNARKYYLLSLFQVPAGDFPDPDDDDANQHRASGPVPGPSPAPKKEAAAAPAQESAAPADSAGAIDPAEGPPHKLVLPQGTTAEQFATIYIRAIGKAKTLDELGQWDKLNDEFLQRISDRYSSIYDRIKTAVDSRGAALSPAYAMPDAKADPQEAMNWVAGQLQQFSSYEAGEAFWNQVVAPHEAEFDQTDWEMLMGEWRRFEQRFPLDEPA